MKHLLLLVLALFSAGGLRAETIDLHEYGWLGFTLDAAAWKVAVSDIKDGNYEVMISPRGGTNAYAGFTLVIRPGLTSTSKERLQTALVAESREEAEGSVERRTVPKEFPVRKGFGFSADYTDRALVGKPPRKGDFPVQTKLMLVLEEKVGITGSIASPGFNDPAHQQLLAMFQSMELLPPAPVKK